MNFKLASCLLYTVYFSKYIKWIKHFIYIPELNWFSQQPYKDDTIISLIGSQATDNLKNCVEMGGIWNQEFRLSNPCS